MTAKDAADKRKDVGQKIMCRIRGEKKTLKRQHRQMGLAVSGRNYPASVL